MDVYIQIRINAISQAKPAICRNEVSMKVIIFGTGRYYQNRKHSLAGIDIVAFLDNDPGKQHTEVDEKPVFLPQEIEQLSYDYICIMSGPYFAPMREQLISLGVSEGAVIDYSQLLGMTGGQMLYYRSMKGMPRLGAKRALLFSHELELTGAPIVLLYMAYALKKMGFAVTVLSRRDGELRYKYMENDIPVIVNDHLSGDDQVLVEWMAAFDLIVINTLVFGEFLGEIERQGESFDVPIIWWLHEGTEVYQGWWPRANPGHLYDNVHVLAVGARALRVYQEYFHDNRAKSLIYGLPDANPELMVQEKDYDKDKMIFALVAGIQPRKGQDLLIDAIRLLPEEDRQRAEFWFIGPKTETVYPEYNARFMEAAASFPQIKYMGVWPMERMAAEYPNIDVIVCPSRDDPMPVVIPEAMMFFKPCIASVGSGTASYIVDYKNGLRCEINAEDIAEKIKWYLHNPGELPQMGKESRKLYEELFSIESFEKNLAGIIDDCVKKDIP